MKGSGPSKREGAVPSLEAQGVGIEEGVERLGGLNRSRGSPPGEKVKDCEGMALIVRAECGTALGRGKSESKAVEIVPAAIRSSSVEGEGGGIGEGKALGRGGEGGVIAVEEGEELGGEG